MLAVVGGGHDEGQTVFRRCAAPEKIGKVPFGKLWVNSPEAATAWELGQTGWLEWVFWANYGLLLYRILWID